MDNANILEISQQTCVFVCEREGSRVLAHARERETEREMEGGKGKMERERICKIKGGDLGGEREKER